MRLYVTTGWTLAGVVQPPWASLAEPGAHEMVHVRYKWTTSATPTVWMHTTYKAAQSLTALTGLDWVHLKVCLCRRYESSGCSRCTVCPGCGTDPARTFLFTWCRLCRCDNFRHPKIPELLLNRPNGARRCLCTFNR